MDGALILDRWGACCDMCDFRLIFGNCGLQLILLYFDAFRWHADPMMMTAGTHDVVLEYVVDAACSASYMQAIDRSLPAALYMHAGD